MPTVPINLSPERPVLDGRELHRLAAAFLEDPARGVCSSTRRNNRNQISHLLTWWTDYGPAHGFLLDAAGLTGFATHLESVPSKRGAPLAFSTRYQILSTVRHMFSWAHRMGYIPVDFGESVPLPRGGTTPLRPVADVSALSALLDATLRTRYPLRNQAIIATLAGTGIRSIECSALLVDDLTMYADGSGVLRLRVAKGNRPRVVAFDTSTGAYLSRHLDGYAAPPSAPLFASERCAPLPPKAIYSIIHKLALRAGVSDRIHGGHDLRRMFATSWTRAMPGEGYGALLQRQLGHASYAMTTHYVMQDIDDVAEVLRSGPVSPVAALEARTNGRI